MSMQEMGKGKEHGVLKIARAEDVLMGRPTPHYLIGEVTVAIDGRSLEATAFFPSSDASIGTRGHINIAHYLFGIWNASHILLKENGLSEARSVEGKWKAYQEMGPDIPLNLQLEITDVRSASHLAKGQMEARYRMDGKIVAEFTSGFVAWR